MNSVPPTPKPAPGAAAAPRKITKARLHNIALHHLERFSASGEGLRRVLERRVFKAGRAGAEVPEEAPAWIAEILDTLRRQGYLDDARFADSTARSLAARGQSLRAIRQRLAAKGVARDHVDAALARLAEDLVPAGEDAAQADPDMAAAVAYARRRRLGPWRPPEVRADFRQKDMAALARRGFSADVTRRLLDAEGPDEAEDMALGR
ncbi:regulatory protein RecX [Novispirillum sp. DQ9]|uniref:regulatory protein RecX n=1 Tax=Novispirillum sp. DQ9 TaxID=3398612 RepID=UPI003C7C9E37